MPSLILRNVPEEVHRKLKERAARHHRSMTKEAVAILEEELSEPGPVRIPEPVKPKKPIPASVIDRAIEEGRE